MSITDFEYQTKQCTHCMMERDISLFHKNKYCTDGRRIVCKYCVSKERQERYKVAKNQPNQCPFNEMTCTKCNLTKPIADFGDMPTATFGKKLRCRACERFRQRKQEETKRNCPYGRIKIHHKSRKTRLRKLYGMTIADYDIMLHSQNGLCAICGKPETAKRHDKHNGEIRDMAVDHCHETGKVRGLLCCNCNQGIGKLGDNIQTLKNAIAYLEKHSR